MNCLNKEFQKSVDELLTSGKKASTDAKPKIQRVPAILRGQKDSNSDKYYEPRWMSIGPIHHANPKFELAEKYKLELAAKFIRDGGHASWKDFYNAKKVELRGLKDCFDKEITDKYDSEGDTDDLSLILFFDGCATLQFIHSCCSEGRYHELKEMKMKNDLVAFTTHDLFLLENQIPYQVLALLIRDRQDIEKLKDSIVAFIIRNIMAPGSYQEDIKAVSLHPEPAHLLDLLLSALIRKTGKKNPTAEGTDPQQNSSTTTNSVLTALTRKMGEKSLTLKRKEPKQIISATTSPVTGNVERPESKPRGTGCEFQFCGLIRSDVENQGSSAIERCPCWRGRDKPKEQQSFRSIMDLKAAGINLKPSETSSLRDVHFSSLGFAGTLKLPPLLVDDSTGSKFMNLIAYEMCPDNTKTEYEVTSYIGFLDSLIDYPADVKELRSAQILHNLLGCDKEVAALFNKIATDLVPNQDMYKSVIERIERHYKSTWMTWMAQVYNEHFSSPWTTVTFIAAVLAIGMSAIQTWFTVYSVEGPCDKFCHHLKKL